MSDFNLNNTPLRKLYRKLAWGLLTKSFQYYSYIKGFIEARDQPEIQRYGVLFVHIPKSAGLAIRKSLFNDQHHRGHAPAIYWKARLGKKYDKISVFSIIRRPEDRLSSAFQFLKQGGLTEKDAKKAKNLGLDRLTYHEFIERLDKDFIFSCRVLLTKHFLPQAWFISDLSGKIIVPYVFKVDNPSTIEAWAKESLHKKITLEKYNVTKNSPQYDKEAAVSSSVFFNFIYKKDTTIWNMGHPSTDN